MGISWDRIGYTIDNIHARWCPRSIAKLVPITPITMVFVGDISMVNEVYKPIYY